VKIENVTHTFVFGTELEISADFHSQATIDEVYIVLQPEGQSSRQIKLIPQDETLYFSYDLNHDPLQPFARVYYWFEVIFIDAPKYTSPSYWFDYTDNRFVWRENNSRLFEVYWLDDDSVFGQKVQDIARVSLENSTRILPLAPNLPIKIYVYPDVTSLQDTLSLTHQPWVAGHASPELGVVLVTKNNDPTITFDLERQTSHELMHILQYQILQDHYADAPAWLLEGLSTYAESYPNPDFERVMADAVKSNTLLPFKDLCDSLPLSTTDSLLGYAQSSSLVQFIEQSYGTQAFIDMLKNSTSRLACSEIVQTSLGISLAQLQDNWKEAVFSIPPEKGWNSTWTLITFIILVIAAAGLLFLREFKKRKKMNSRDE